MSCYENKTKTFYNFPKTYFGLIWEILGVILGKNISFLALGMGPNFGPLHTLKKSLITFAYIEISDEQSDQKP
jgi:hypothetical protein